MSVIVNATHRLVSYRPGTACAVPRHLLGALCQILNFDTRLELVTCAVYDPNSHAVKIIQLDAKCVERI